MGIKKDSKKWEFQNKMMCGQFSVHQNALYFYDKMTNVKSMKDTPVVSFDHQLSTVSRCSSLLIWTGISHSCDCKSEF